MSSEIMRSQPNPNPVSCLLHHAPGSFVGKGENPLLGLNPVVSDVFLQSVSHFLRDENMLPIFTAFRVSKRQFPVVNVHRSQLQHFFHSNAATGHQFKHKTVPQFFGCKYDFVDNIFSDDFLGNHGSGPEHLSEHRAVAGAAKVSIDIGSDEVEEGCEVGVFDAFGLLFLAFGDPVQKFKDFVCGDGFDVSLPKILAESREKRFIRLNRISFVS